MSRFKNAILGIVALAALAIGPSAASAYGPVRWAIRPVVRVPVGAVRATRVATPPYGPYFGGPRAYGPRVYVGPGVIVAPSVVIVR